MGITCFLLLMLYARYELSYDSFFKHSDRIFQLEQYLPEWKHGGSNYFASTSGIVAPTLKEEFTFPLKTGNIDTALKDPFSIVLSQTLSKNLFGSERPIGKIVTYQNGQVLKVTGIVEDVPGNTHLKFDYLISFLTMYSLRDDIDSSWGILNYNNYIQLKDKVAYRDFE